MLDIYCSERESPRREEGKGGAYNWSSPSQEASSERGDEHDHEDDLGKLIKHFIL
jgi:hypothetical protein